MSNAITDKPDGRPGPPADAGPSRLRQDEPTFARAVGMGGAALAIFGGMALAFHMFGQSVRVGPGVSGVLFAAGLAGLLFHAAFDREIQFRRLYGAFALLFLLVGVALAFLPKVEDGGEKYLWGARLAYGVPCVMLGMLFFLAFQRNEDDERLLKSTQLIFGGAGVAFALIGLVGGLFRGEFLLPYGFVYALMGLVLLIAFIGTRGISDDLGYYTAAGTGGLGALAIVLVLARSLTTQEGPAYFVSFGLILVLAALFYVAAGAVMALDWPVFVLLRRDLGSFFFSPVAYMALFAFCFFAWVSYSLLLTQLTPKDATMTEPIITGQFFDYIPVFVLIFVVPILTMRLLSEEARTGTLEVLFTAPVDEGSVVLAKFLCALLTFLIVWLPFGLILLTIPLLGGDPFDYRPLLAYSVGLTVTGAAFMSMGLFCSSLTQNQIGSGLLTFVGMLLWTVLWWVARIPEVPEWARELSKHMSYLHVWRETLQGKIVVRQLLFPLSATVLFLFLTVKVLESRKWR